MLRKIDVKEISGNPFTRIGDQWMLITAGTKDNCNTMTASWGGLGVLWGKPVATIFVRPQRHTYQFTEENDWFTLSFLKEDYREALKLCGTRSGRDMDKFAAAGITVAGEEEKPYVAEAELVLVCRKVYWDDIEPGNFLDGEIDHKCYPTHDYHRMYIGVIEEAWQAD